MTSGMDSSANLPESAQSTQLRKDASGSLSQALSGGFSIEIEYSADDDSLGDDVGDDVDSRDDDRVDVINDGVINGGAINDESVDNRVELSYGSQPLYFLSVNYYSAALLSDLMHTLEANQGIVIVNNSPTDHVVHGFQGQRYAGGLVTVLDAPENGGFGAGCNLGLQWIYARSPDALVWLINPDARLLPQAVSTVRQCFDPQTSGQDISILGTPILDEAGKLWFSSGRFNRWLGSLTSHHAISKNNLGRPQPTHWVSGCSMILNLGVLGHCPQFDDVYFLYYEDCDFCERYFQEGHTIAIAPIPLVVHAVSSITSRYTQPKYVHATFSKLTFLRRHALPLALWLNLAYLFAQSLWLLLRDRAAARGRWMGIQHFLKAPRTRPPVMPVHELMGSERDYSSDYREYQN